MTNHARIHRNKGQMIKNTENLRTLEDTQNGADRVALDHHDAHTYSPSSFTQHSASSEWMSKLSPAGVDTCNLC